MHPNNWYVVTGGPSTGKTTVLGELKNHGFAVVPEAARVVIDEGLAAGQTIETIRGDELKFQEEVARRKEKNEQVLDPQTPTFFDRGMQDTIAYLEQNELAIAPWVHQLMQQSHYQAVFVLEPLSTFTQDYARVEDANFTHKIHDKLITAYRASGMEPIIVPDATVGERVDFILDAIKSKQA